MRIPLIVCLIFLVSCGEREELVISATACAQNTKEGVVVECEPSEWAVNDLDKFMARVKRIDAEYPGPKTPGFEVLYSVTEVTSQGGLVLEDGRQIMLAGVQCNGHPELEKYLKGEFLLAGTSKVLYQLTGSKTESSDLAYVWVVDPEFGKDLDGDGVAFGPMSSNINETALSSGWCKPTRQAGHEYHERYEQLSELAP